MSTRSVVLKRVGRVRPTDRVDPRPARHERAEVEDAFPIPRHAAAVANPRATTVAEGAEAPARPEPAERHDFCERRVEVAAAALGDEQHFVRLREIHAVDMEGAREAASARGVARVRADNRNKPNLG